MSLNNKLYKLKEDFLKEWPIDTEDDETSTPIVTVKSFEKMKPEIIISESYSYNK